MCRHMLQSSSVDSTKISDKTANVKDARSVRQKSPWLDRYSKIYQVNIAICWISILPLLNLIMVGSLQYVETELSYPILYNDPTIANNKRKNWQFLTGAQRREWMGCWGVLGVAGIPINIYQYTSIRFINQYNGIGWISRKQMLPSGYLTVRHGKIHHF